ncbi:MAG: hypothetical protein LBE24_10645 [Methylobacillus sp.]|jgi:hypothetical protein|nr:hypothetical protein [Methylobacillus sp.]
MLGLEYEQHLIDRLNSFHLNGRPAPDIAAAIKTGHGLPAVFVVYQGPRVLPGAGDLQGPVEAMWYFVIGVKDVSDQLTGARARAAAAPIADKVVAAFRGWMPPGSGWPMRLTNAPRPQFAAGMLWLPIGFLTTSHSS